MDALSSSNWLSGHLNLSIREGRDNGPADPQATSVCSQIYEPTLSSDPIGLTSILSVQLYTSRPILHLFPVSYFLSFRTAFMCRYSVLFFRIIVPFCYRLSGPYASCAFPSTIIRFIRTAPLLFRKRGGLC
jgi:hypothetical protein